MFWIGNVFCSTEDQPEMAYFLSFQVTAELTRNLNTTMMENYMINREKTEAMDELHQHVNIYIYHLYCLLMKTYWVIFKYMYVVCSNFIWYHSMVWKSFVRKLALSNVWNKLNGSHSENCSTCTCICCGPDLNRVQLRTGPAQNEILIWPGPEKIWNTLTILWILFAVQMLWIWNISRLAIQSMVEG